MLNRMKWRAGAALPMVVALTAGSAMAQLPNGVASGDTTANSTVLWARSLTSGNVTFDLSTSPLFDSILQTTSVNVADNLVPAKAGISGLDANTRYYYRATDASGASYAGTFKTAGAGGSKNGLRLGVSGDWRGDVAPFPFAKNVPDRNLDLWISLGDTIYADVESPGLPGVSQAQTLNQFRQKHAEIYTEKGGLNTLADLRASTSILATIDDHEVTNDFAGYNTVANDARFSYGGAAPTDHLNKTPLFNNGVQAFTEWHPIESKTYNTPGNARFDGVADLYRKRQYGDDAVILMADARSFRDKELAPVTNPLDPSQVQGFIGASWDPSRTMLGNTQFQRLTQDLLTAQASGVTWKFVNIGEPTQNFGVLGGEDRYEGYAAERAALLSFIKTNNIQNVVFVTADIHGTVVNNLTYQTNPLGAQIQSGAWEISTGSGGYDAPFGPTIAGLADQLNLPGALDLAVYLALPTDQQEAYIQGLINAQAAALGYSPIGLQDSNIPANLLKGGWTATNSYGWTEFDIDPATQALTVTTYGIPWYPAGTDPALIAGLEPQIISQFVVDAIPAPSSLALVGVAGLIAGRRRR